MIRNLFLTLILGVSVLSGPASAQAPELSNIAGGEKKPHRDTVLTTKALPPAEAKKLQGKLYKIRDLVRATPALRDLRGHDWGTSTSIKNHHDAARPVIASVLHIAYPYLKDPRTGKPISSEEGPGFTIHVNDPEVVLGQGLYNVDQEARFALEPRSAGELDGYPVYYGQFVVLSKHGQPLFTPVSQEHYLTRLIEKSRKELDKMRARARSAPAPNPAAQQKEIERALAQLKAARDEQEKRWALMASKWPDRVTAERAKFDEKEKKKREEIEALGSGNPQQRFMAPFEEKQKALEAELASLSPADRSAPSYHPRSPNKDRASGLAAPGATDGTRIVTLNPALFDPKKPKSAIQLLILGTTQYSPKIYDAVQRQLDKAALLGLID